ncbi:MAG: nucleotidyltransferase domain-containing protein [Patescibacteria group bacterium]|nr:nucleotidyltransferase domain-containing protein [Patescibacteria group bacterium]
MINIDSLKPNIKSIAEKHALSMVVLFGSQATGAVHANSDIDIAIMSTRSVDLSVLYAEFSDLFLREDIEIVTMNDASPTMMHVLIRDGKLLYEHKSGAFLSWKFYAIWVWLDTAWLRRLRDRKLVEWAKTV